MTSTPASFALCSSQIAAFISEGKPLNFESKALLEAAKNEFEEVIAIHPSRVFYQFIRGKEKPNIHMDGRDLNSLSCLLIRGTKGYEQSISVLVGALSLCGCFILDPANRFTGQSASKLLTTIDRFEKTFGSDSYYAFSLEKSLYLIRSLSNTSCFPMVTKPIEGKQGQGIKLLSTEQEAIAYAHLFFGDESEKDIPFFLQPYMKFEAEYRVIIVGSKVMGVARKDRREGELAANAAAGGTFTVVDNQEVAHFVLENVNPVGILGVDVAKDSKGGLHIIEANRAPLWQEFERVTGVNIAQEIIAYAKRNCH